MDKIIDLTHIIYRAHEKGDTETGEGIGPTTTGAYKVSLAGIHFRSRQRSQDDPGRDLDE
jgi:hypothetical protein